MFYMSVGSACVGAVKGIALGHEVWPAVLVSSVPVHVRVPLCNTRSASLMADKPSNGKAAALSIDLGHRPQVSGCTRLVRGGFITSLHRHSLAGP